LSTYDNHDVRDKFYIWTCIGWPRTIYLYFCVNL